MLPVTDMHGSLKCSIFNSAKSLHTEFLNGHTNFYDFFFFVTASTKILFPRSPKSPKWGQDFCEAKETHNCVWSLVMGNSFSKLHRRFNVQGNSFSFFKRWSVETGPWLQRCGIKCNHPT